MHYTIAVVVIIINNQTLPSVPAYVNLVLHFMSTVAVADCERTLSPPERRAEVRDEGGVGRGAGAAGVGVCGRLGSRQTDRATRQINSLEVSTKLPRQCVHQLSSLYQMTKTR